MNDKDFVNLVNRELRRNATEEERAYLWSMPDIVMRWRAELIAIKSLCSLETQKVKANLEGAHDLYLKARPDGEGKINEEARAEWHAFRDEQIGKRPISIGYRQTWISALLVLMPGPGHKRNVHMRGSENIEPLRNCDKSFSISTSYAIKPI